MSGIHIVLVLDRSGSMERVKSDTEGGIKSFMDEQLATSPDATASLYQFDTEHEAVYRDTPIAEVPKFELHPRGGTALLDGIGLTIADVRARRASIAPEDRSDVVVVITTDGEENSSREYTQALVRTLLTQVQEEGWAVLFLGADQDAFTVAGGIGIARGQTLSYGSAHTAQTWSTVSGVTARGAQSGQYGFTEDEQGEVA